LHGHWDVGVRCDEDDRYLPIRRGEVTLKLKTASPWHSHVEHQAGRAVWEISLEKIGNRRKFSRMQADRLQEQGDRGAKLAIVIDDQHARIVVRHAEVRFRESSISH
jgi:hypothetical protein